MTQLEEWNAQFGGEDYTTPSKSSTPAFELDRTYHVRVKAAKLMVTDRGTRQLELTLSALKSDGEEGFSRREWVTLPKQPATDPQHPADKVRTWTLRRRDDLGKVLQSVEPALYRLAESVEGPGGKRQYVDANGNAVSKDALEDRKVEVNRAVMAFADDCHARIDEGAVEVEDLLGAEFFIVKKENPRNDKYPYTNIYATPDSRIPMWEG